MKKLVALILSLCMLLGCGAAMADNEMNWEDVAPTLEAVGITGQFYTFEQIAVAIFIPDGMELAAEMPSEKFIGLFTAPDGSYVAVTYVDLNGMDLETYATVLPEVGAASIEMGTLNGLPCVTYEMPENGTMNVAFTTEAGYVLEVYTGPVTTDEEKLGGSVILASVQSL